MGSGSEVRKTRKIWSMWLIWRRPPRDGRLDGMATALQLVSEKRGRGRPPMVFNALIFHEICEEVAASEKGLRTVLASDSRFPSVPTFLKWLNLSDEYAAMYARSKAQQADMLAEDILDISDDPDLDANDKRVRVDSRKWLLSKLVPKKYGDKLDITSAGERLAPNSQHIDQRVQSIVMRAAGRMAVGKKVDLSGLDEEALRLLE